MKSRLIKKFRFDAAHHLPTFPEGHKCRQLHGHTFHVELVLEGEVDPAVGYLMDFGEIKRVAGPVMDGLDHQLLNDIPGLEVPTGEVLSRWLFDRLKPDLPYLALVRVWESPDNAAESWGQ